jgi:hypothetical protein
MCNFNIILWVSQFVSFHKAFQPNFCTGHIHAYCMLCPSQLFSLIALENNNYIKIHMTLCLYNLKTQRMGLIPIFNDVCLFYVDLDLWMPYLKYFSRAATASQVRYHDHRAIWRVDPLLTLLSARDIQRVVAHRRVRTSLAYLLLCVHYGLRSSCVRTASSVVSWIN